MTDDEMYPTVLTVGDLIALLSSFNPTTPIWGWPSNYESWPYDGGVTVAIDNPNHITFFK